MVDTVYPPGNPGGSVWDRTTEERLRLIAQGLADNEEIHRKLPGLRTLLNEYVNPAVPVTSADFHRRLLRVFRDSDYDSAYQDNLEKLSPDEKERIEKFVAEDKSLDDVSHDFDMCMSLGVREHLQHLIGVDCAHVSSAGVQVFMAPPEGGAAQPPVETQVEGLSGRSHFDWVKDRDTVFHSFLHEMKELFTGHLAEHKVVVYKDVKFQNWGRGVEYVPQYTCIPNSVASVQRIVHYAKKHDMTVRCAGFRHSWAPLFGQQGQITISLLSLAEATKIPNFTALSKVLPEWLLHKNELQTIDVVPGTPRVKGNVLVRIGASTTNEQLRRWCVTHNKYTYPLNVIMVEMTVGGTNAPICHGAGRAHQTLSDLVRKVEYVDCNGKLQTVTSPSHLLAAAGCFGLMGVITHLTLEFQPMTYALMQPQKLPVVRAIPPPASLPESAIPPALRLPNLTPADKAADLARFRDRATSWYYAEWFWFPYADTCWVNCWNDTPGPANDVEDYPSNEQTFLMFLAQFTTNTLQDAAVLTELITALGLDEAVVTLLSEAAMLVMPTFDPPLKTYLTDALHFQRGIQNIRVLDVEVEIALPPSRENPEVPDWEVVQRAWWEAILACYAHSKDAPQRMPLEMRVMGGSEVIMAPQSGNRLGTCSIEVLTLEAARGVWMPYAEEVVGRWLALKDGEGRAVKVRPHWAKMWRGMRLADGREWVEKMKGEDYREERAEFLRVLGEIGSLHGWEVGDLRRRFGNEFLDWFYFEGV
ncbi:putative xylitol oxidase [Parachaetomium inaequale]|uniref:Xylitol oxidase n=1 Tax=Parachaetomium inaequale TaxID=2588326 RepID=A0AAN6PB28_9PEZI|nr:putative xylitol oxidase [Parachaetomium inaequale]